MGTQEHLYQLWGVDAPAHVSLRPHCVPWIVKGILVLWHCWRYETNSTLILLVCQLKSFYFNNVFSMLIQFIVLSIDFVRITNCFYDYYYDYGFG